MKYIFIVTFVSCTFFSLNSFSLKETIDLEEWKLEKMKQVLIEINEFDSKEFYDTTGYAMMGLPYPDLRQNLLIDTITKTNHYNIYLWRRDMSHRTYLYAYESGKTFVAFTEHQNKDKLLEQILSLIDLDNYKINEEDKERLRTSISKRIASNFSISRRE